MTAQLARALADRQLGIGCDQLILLEPSTIADVKMRIWNHDGIEVESCGNASRCVVALTHAKTIETAGGPVNGAEDGNEVEVYCDTRRAPGGRPYWQGRGQTLDLRRAEAIAAVEDAAVVG